MPTNIIQKHRNINTFESLWFFHAWDGYSFERLTISETESQFNKIPYVGIITLLVSFQSNLTPVPWEYSIHTRHTYMHTQVGFCEDHKTIWNGFNTWILHLCSIYPLKIFPSVIPPLDNFRNLVKISNKDNHYLFHIFTFNCHLI